MISDEDYMDYDNDGYGENFDEDALDDEEYELLHDILPPFKDRVKSANYTDISDDLLKEYIWEANYDPDEAFEIIKENHKRMYYFIVTQSFLTYFTPTSLDSPSIF